MIEDLKRRLKAYSTDVVVEGQRRREKAAVLLPILTQPEPALVLTQRSSNLDNHAGEVAWPGGKQDPDDDSLLTTALRETWEEIGLPPQRCNIIAELRPFISKFGLLVTPYVGLIEEPVELNANPDELEAIFKVPLSWLKDDPRTQTDIVSRYGETHRVPVYHYEGFRIWGLTAMILWEFMVKGMAVNLNKDACDKLQNKVNNGWEIE
ncbi:MAG: CoA pyrophosphatase [Gammaproteobacteria bacterium]|nr:CoA pyrophosphatase [Gammaproteobacteria bacterium]